MFSDGNFFVYVAGPFTAESRWKTEENIRSAERAGLRLLELGYVPIIPHSMYGTMDGEFDYNFWLDTTMELLRLCGSIYMCDGWEESRGSVAELQEARRLGLEVIPSWRVR